MNTQKTPRTLKELGLNPDYALRVQGKGSRWRVGSIFYELRSKEVNGKPPIWTLGDYDRIVDGVTYPSLRGIYLDCEDPTEYKFAIKAFGSWKFWDRIKANKELCRLAFDSWREELDVLLVSKGVSSVISEVGNGKGSFVAAKYLTERGWIKKKDTRGRPSKKTIANEATKMIKVKDEVELELERAELLINGD